MIRPPRLPFGFRRQLPLMGFISLFAACGALWIIFGKASMVYIAPDSIESDCSVDVAGEIQSWIASVPDGNTAQFKLGGCYKMESQVEMAHRSNLVIDGNSATFRADTINEVRGDYTTHRRHFVFRGGTNLTLKNLTFQGPNTNGDRAPDLEGQHVVTLHGVNGLVIDNIRGTNVYGDFITVWRLINEAPRNGAAYSRNVVIRNSYFKNSGRQGISVVAAEDVTIENNEFANTRITVIDIEQDSPAETIRRVKVLNNKIGTFSGFFVAAAGAAGPLSDIEISGNHSSTSVVTWILAKDGEPRRSNIKITNNIGDAARSNFVFRLNNLDNVTVQGNKQAFFYHPATTYSALELETVKTTVVRDNDFTGARFLAKDIDGDAQYTSCNNTISPNGTPVVVDGTCPVAPPPPVTVTPPVGSDGGGGEQVPAGGGSGPATTGSADNPGGSNTVNGGTTNPNNISPEASGPLSKSFSKARETLAEAAKNPTAAVGRLGAVKSLGLLLLILPLIIGTIFGLRAYLRKRKFQKSTNIPRQNKIVTSSSTPAINPAEPTTKPGDVYHPTTDKTE